MVGRKGRFRGSRTHGRGHKAGRGKGKRGGTGNAGWHKHKFKYMLKYFPDHFGRHGFKRPQGIVQEVKVINISDVEENLSKYLLSSAAKQIEGKIQVDLGSLGFDKLLASGKATLPLTIIVPIASKTAVEKVKKAGGVVVAEKVTDNIPKPKAPPPPAKGAPAKGAPPAKGAAPPAKGATMAKDAKAPAKPPTEKPAGKPLEGKATAVPAKPADKPKESEKK